MKMTRSMTKIIKFINKNSEQEENLDKNTHKKKKNEKKKKKKNITIRKIRIRGRR